jgi:GTPase SAR1 family protein
MISFNHISGSHSVREDRALAYREADVFLLCYKVSEPSSLFNAINHWCPEVRSIAPATPIILVGCQADLRGDRDILHNLSKQGRNVISSDQGLSFSQQMNALMYVETSAKTSTRAAISAFEVAGLASMGKLVKPRSPRSTPSPKATNKKKRFSEVSPQNSLERNEDDIVMGNQPFWDRLQSPKLFTRSISEAPRTPSLNSSRSASLSSKSIPSISSLGTKTPKASRKASVKGQMPEKTMTIKCQRLTADRTYEEIEVEVPVPIYETIQLYNDTGSLAARSKERHRSIGSKLRNLFSRSSD